MIIPTLLAQIWHNSQSLKSFFLPITVVINTSKWSIWGQFTCLETRTVAIRDKLTFLPYIIGHNVLTIVCVSLNMPPPHTHMGDAEKFSTQPRRDCKINSKFFGHFVRFELVGQVKLITFHYPSATVIIR